MKLKKQDIFPAYPFFLAAASVLLLLFVNKAEVQPLVGLRLLVVMLLVTAILYLILLLIFKNRYKAAFLSSIIVFLFTSYGHLFNVLQKAESLSFLAHHRYVSAFYLVILVLSTVFVIRLKKPEKWTWSLNLVMGIAFALPLLQVIVFYAKDALSSQAWTPLGSTDLQELVASRDDMPDIYYIILDSYTRQDSLLDNYGFDNSDFIEGLRNRGFYVADCSRSNYAHTYLSLSSSLNMNYLSELGMNVEDNSNDSSLFKSMILNSMVRKQLVGLGYHTVAFESGYSATDMKDADYYYKSASNLLLSPYIEPFEYLFLDNSVFRVIINTEFGFVYNYFSKLVFPFNDQKMRVLNVFERLPEVPELAGPKYIFVHLEIPHHPFIFQPDGSINPDRSFYPGTYMPWDIDLMEAGYINQVQYVNSEILSIVDDLLERSAQPPVIILQGDHGLEAGDRVEILNAIYLPDGNSKDLHSSISPVNTFRVVFNQYFGTRFPLLDDVSYYSSSADKMKLTLIEEKKDGCISK